MQHCFFKFFLSPSSTPQLSGIGLPLRAGTCNCSTGTIIHARSISWHSRQANTGTLRHRVWRRVSSSGSAECLSSVNTPSLAAASHPWSALCPPRDRHSKAWPEYRSPELSSEPANQPTNQPVSHTSSQPTRFPAVQFWISWCEVALVRSAKSLTVRQKSEGFLPCVIKLSGSLSLLRFGQIGVKLSTLK